MSALAVGSSLLFRQPLALVALVLPLLLLGWAYGPGRRARLRLAARATYAWPVFLIVLATAEPVHLGAARPPALIVAEDVSGSRGEAARADDVRWSRVPVTQHLVFGEAHATDVATALMKAAARGEAGRGDVLVLLSDGRDDNPAAGEVVRDLREKGWQVVRGSTLETEAPPGATSPRRDVAVQEIAVVGAAPSAGAPLHLVARLAATAKGHVRVSAVQDGAAVSLPAPFATGEGALAAGLTEIPFTVAFPRGRGRTVVEVAISYVDAPDPWPGNDRATGTFAARPPPEAWLVSDDKSQSNGPAAVLAALLAKRGFSVARKTPSQLVAATRADFPALVWLLDVAAGEVEPGAVARLDDFLREGGGLVVTGGPHAYGPGGYATSPLERLLPVTSDDRRRAEEPTLALVLVLDRSGSMAGPKLDLTKEGARAALRLLPTGAAFGVIAFDAQPLTLVPLQVVHDRERLEGALDRLIASGGTNIAVGLREGIEALRTSSAGRKHAILLSDGQSAPEGIPALVDAARDSGITFSTVAVGDGADQHLLRSIASRGGGRAYFTAEPASLPRLFASETLTLTRQVPAGPVARTTRLKPHPVTDGLIAEGLLRPRELARTHRRAGTDALLDHGSAPLLTCGNVGLGRSCAFSAELLPPRDARPSSGPAPQDEAARLWEQLARFAARSPGVQTTELDLRQHGQAIVVRLEPGSSSAAAGLAWRGPWPVAAVVKTARDGTLTRVGPHRLMDVEGTTFRAILMAPRAGEDATVAVWRSPQAAREGAPPWLTKPFVARDEEGPASWERRRLPTWWTSLPVVTPEVVTPGHMANLTTNLPPPRRERPLRTPLLVAAAAFLIAAARPRRGIVHP